MTVNFMAYKVCHSKINFLELILMVCHVYIVHECQRGDVKRIHEFSHSKDLIWRVCLCTRWEYE